MHPRMLAFVVALFSLGLSPPLAHAVPRPWEGTLLLEYTRLPPRS